MGVGPMAYSGGMKIISLMLVLAFSLPTFAQMLPSYASLDEGPVFIPDPFQDRPAPEPLRWDELQDDDWFSPRYMPRKYQVNPRDLKESDLAGLNTISKKEFEEIALRFGETNKDERRFFSFNQADQQLLALAAATSLGLIVFKGDDELMDVVQGNKNDFTRHVADFGNVMGTVSGIGPIALGSFFLGVVFENGKLKDVGIVAVTAALATQFVTEGFKDTFERARPNYGVGPYAFQVDGQKSFFSGHSSGAFSIATVLAETYGEEHKWVPWLAYGVAAVTAYARMHDMKHWGSDVIMGAIAGHLITKITYRLYRGDRVPERERWIYLSPMVGRDYVGFQITAYPSKRPRWR